VQKFKEGHRLRLEPTETDLIFSKERVFVGIKIKSLWTTKEYVLNRYTE
jgi:hypothetical protein